MRRRVVSILIAAVILSLCMPFPVFASVGSGGSIWDLADAIGGFFSSLINAIGTFISNSIKAILDGLVSLFVPSSNYFESAFSKIKTNFDKKFGGIIETANYLSNLFKNIKAHKDTANLFTIKFPQGHIFAGKSLNLLSGSEAIQKMIRGALSGILILYTVAFVYKKVRQMINA